MSPNETLFLESTNKVVKEDICNSSFVQFHIWDFPGQIDFFDPTFDSDNIFGGCDALIFVIDAQVIIFKQIFYLLITNNITNLY
jgi:Ras-related GTP-binding protein C/D